MKHVVLLFRILFIRTLFLLFVLLGGNLAMALQSSRLQFLRTSRTSLSRNNNSNSNNLLHLLLLRQHHSRDEDYTFARIKNSSKLINTRINNIARHSSPHHPLSPRTLYFSSSDANINNNSCNKSNINMRTISSSSLSSYPQRNKNNQPQHQAQQSLSNDDDESHSWSNYERLVRKLYQTNLFIPVKLGLENMNKLHEILGSPMDQPNITVIHIAGSNGKGSVALKTANTFQRANYKVGLFVSPHISSFRERIQINGVPISESHVEQYLQEIFDICEKNCIPATFFEVTTALAFHVFSKEEVEVVVLETGLGGRLDATNVICRPALSVIISIGLEHTKILGDTIEKIALEKGGIMKENCQVLVGKNVPWTVLRQCAEEKKVSEIFQCDDVLGPDNQDGQSELVADYDAENSRIASAAVILVQFYQTQQRLNNRMGGQEVKLISSDEISQGVKIRPPCRFEEMDIPVTITSSSVDDGSKSNEVMVRVILDVAHNPQAMDYLIAKLKTNYPNDSVRMVVGMSADKDLKYCTDVLLEYVSHTPERIHLVEASHPRAASISSILKANPALVPSHYETQPVDSNLDDMWNDLSVSKQVRAALQLAAKNNETVVICGSVFIMADAREELGIIEPRDSAVIAQVAGAGMRSSQENFGSNHQGG